MTMDLTMYKDHLTEEEIRRFTEKVPILENWVNLTEEERGRYWEDEDFSTLMKKVYEVSWKFASGELSYDPPKVKEETGQRVLNTIPVTGPLPIMTFEPNVSGAELDHLFEKEEFTHTGPVDVMVCLREGDTVRALCKIKNCMVHDMYEQNLFIKDAHGIRELILDDVNSLDLTVPGKFSEDEERPVLYRVQASPDVEMVTYDTDIRNVCPYVQGTQGTGAGFYLLFEKNGQ